MKIKNLEESLVWTNKELQRSNDLLFASNKEKAAFQNEIERLNQRTLGEEEQARMKEHVEKLEFQRLFSEENLKLQHKIDLKRQRDTFGENIK